VAIHDVVIIGGGVSGLAWARDLAAAGMAPVVLEAGNRYDRRTYPRTELDGSAQLYWGGGVELTTDAAIGILRPKVVGGGSVVNQALMDRFDDLAFSDWRAVSGVDWFSVEAMGEWYDRAEGHLTLNTVPEQWRNRNAEIFAEGFRRNGYQSAPLRRAQTDCHFEDGNCCVECLTGCRIDSKQSTAITALPSAEADGATLVSQVEVVDVREHADHIEVVGRYTVSSPRAGESETWKAHRLVLASGAIGNTRLLLASGYADRLPALGTNFHTHPQYMNFGVFDEPVNAHKGPLQNYKSADPGFRRQGFKLENVYAGPSSIAMLMPGFGRAHMARMRQMPHFGCIEVCVRDTEPGRIRLARNGATVVEKKLNTEDRRRRAAGMSAIRNIFASMGAREVIEGDIGIGLHLMGGCGMGTDPRTSVVAPDFTLHGSPRIHVADSSVFPNAPGINPSLTVSALTIRAAAAVVKEA
jgi:choline dehydrogenase-like flavoprotein